MFDLSIQELDLEKNNSILKKNINLDKNLDCFIIISSKNKALAENTLNNIIENIIDKISLDETYNDFGIALENINFFLKNWKKNNPIWEWEKEQRLDVVISILNENNFMFSNIWKTWVYMINSNSQVVELTEKWENKKNFLYISSWNLENGDIIITSTINLLKYLSISDLKDSLILADDMEIFWKNIKNILKTEIVKKNCLVTNLRYKNEFLVEENDKFSWIKNFFMWVADTKISKKIAWTVLTIKDKIDLQSKRNKSIFFVITIVLVIIILYFLISKFLGWATQTIIKEETKNSISEIREVLDTASENVQNPILFSKNIKKAEKMIKEVSETNLYKKDIKSLNEEIDILKNQFNKVEIFNADASNAIYTENINNPIKIAKGNGKTYIVTKKWVVWPILKNVKTRLYIFSDLKEDEYFKDFAFIWSNMFLLTNTSKIARFSSNGRFAFINVSWQNIWEEMKAINSYSTNIYSLWKNNQIYKHVALKSTFSKWVEYIKKEDLKSIWEIIDFAIDWWFYIVKKDLTVLKLINNPYRLESLYLNKLPGNYNRKEWSEFKIKAWFNLNYVYMLLNNKIWVFWTNSRNYTDTTNLNYLWQIEGWANQKIIDFFVEKDWEVLVLNEKWVYRLKFEVSDNKIIVR